MRALPRPGSDAEGEGDFLCGLDVEAGPAVAVSVAMASGLVGAVEVGGVEEPEAELAFEEAVLADEGLAGCEEFGAGAGGADVGGGSGVGGFQLVGRVSHGVPPVSAACGWCPRRCAR